MFPSFLELFAYSRTVTSGPSRILPFITYPIGRGRVLLALESAGESKGNIDTSSISSSFDGSNEVRHCCHCVALSWPGSVIVRPIALGSSTRRLITIQLSHPHRLFIHKRYLTIVDELSHSGSLIAVFFH